MADVDEDWADLARPGDPPRAKRKPANLDLAWNAMEGQPEALFAVRRGVDDRAVWIERVNRLGPGDRPGLIRTHYVDFLWHWPFGEREEGVGTSSVAKAEDCFPTLEEAFRKAEEIVLYLIGKEILEENYLSGRILELTEERQHHQDKKRDLYRMLEDLAQRRGDCAGR